MAASVDSDKQLTKAQEFLQRTKNVVIPIVDIETKFATAANEPTKVQSSY